MRVLPLLATAALVFAGAAAAQQYYKWKDSSGTWHYTTTPPPAGAQVEKVNVNSAPVEGAAPAAPAAGAAPTAGAAPAAAPAPVPLAAQRNKMCEDSRARVATLESSPVVKMDTDGDGTPEPLSQEQHGAELQRARELARVYCTQSQ
jgi:hypothetical protein